ncbi:MAG: alkaline phosphatase [Oscillospiraceae bacterium]|jgi:alkaline phosphatase|nr:alkaline phosphatase [Oscillospiraceae bacterium]
MLKLFRQAVALLCTPLVLLFGALGLRAGVSNNYRSYKNVILMIGDGMGFNTLASAKQSLGLEQLVMETMPVQGESETRSWQTVTDSAAGATALACGIRNINGEIAVYPLDPLQVFGTPKSLSELALEHGKTAGVVTTDSTSGATPAGFSAHAASRDEEEKISAGQLASGLTLIWGGGSASVTQAGAQAGGFTLVTDRAGWDALEPGQRSFAQFSNDDLSHTTNTETTPTLEEMTIRAVDVLDDDADGFFLMVEAAHIDKYSHNNDMAGAVHHVAEFDKAIAAALEYADAHNNTLVVVTADHETGGIQYDAAKKEYYYTSDGHTAVNVPLLVSATDAGFTDGQAVKNREVGVQLGLVLGFPADSFPTPLLPRREEAA